jgi:L-asparaginase
MSVTDRVGSPTVNPVEKARVVLFTLGGTVAMAGSDGGGVVTRLSGRDLLAGLDDLDDGVEVDVHDLHTVPSADLSFLDVLDVVAAAEEAVAAGAGGIVLTQGTDTLEEAAFLIDAVWTHDVPFIITGAMRNPTLAGADGPANILAAVRVAAAPASIGRGALVVFNDEIHSPRLVRKAHSTSPATFMSPDVGPLGHVVEGAARFLAQVPRPRPITGSSRTALASTRVALYTMTMDDDGVLLDYVATMHQGLVVAGFGVGHVPGALAPVLGELATTMPVVLSSRTGAGSVLAATYGAVGSERDLRERGLISAGFLHPYKARVLLRLLLAAGAGLDEIAARFAEFG